MARKKHLKNIDNVDMELIDEKMKLNSSNNNYEYVDGYKNQLKLLNYKLDIKCKNEKQKDFLNNLKDINLKVNICDSPAGVGKSLLALTAGLYHLKNGNVSKVIVIVPTVEASEATKIGLLPGSIDEKIMPYKIATMSTLEKILKLSGNVGYHEIAVALVNSGLIEFELLSFARGRNFDDAFIILDEAENLSKKECILLMSRLGEGNSKIALIGDEQQCDRKDIKKVDACGLTYAIAKLREIDGISINEFTNEDIVRNPFLTRLLNAWNS